MATLNDLKSYIGYEFSSGPYTGQDYKTFQTKYINYLRSLCKSNGWELVNVGRNHYCFSCFIKNSESKYVYLSVSDVRGYKPEWYTHVLIRRADSDRDYHGHCNNYSELPDLAKNIERLFRYD